MFMCLTYTGDLLADAFISGYSKIVNCFCRHICRGKLKQYLNERDSLEQADVIYIPTLSLSRLNLSLSSSPNVKRLVMFPLLRH